MNKHLGQEFNRHLYETLRTDDLAVYYYIKTTNPLDKESLANAITNVTLARMGCFITEDGTIKNPNQP